MFEKPIVIIDFINVRHLCFDSERKANELERRSLWRKTFCAKRIVQLRKRANSSERSQNISLTERTTGPYIGC